MLEPVTAQRPSYQNNDDSSRSRPRRGSRARVASDDFEPDGVDFTQTILFTNDSHIISEEMAKGHIYNPQLDDNAGTCQTLDLAC